MPDRVDAVEMAKTLIDVSSRLRADADRTRATATGLRTDAERMRSRTDDDPAGPDPVPQVMRCGEILDLSTLADVHRDLHEAAKAGGQRVVLDLSPLRVCDAAGMRALLHAAHLCVDGGGWLRLAAPAGMVAAAFAAVSFGARIPVYPTVAAALAGEEDQRIAR